MSEDTNGEPTTLNGVQSEVPVGNSEGPIGKREDYLEWPEYFMAVAFLSAQRSKDPSSQVGACIVNPENKIVGIGYNGMPNGCNDDLLPWARAAADRLDTKYPYVCHAELNAIMNKNSADVKGCTIYVALFPCNECAKLIIQAGNLCRVAARLSLILIQLTTLEGRTCWGDRVSLVSLSGRRRWRLFDGPLHGALPVPPLMPSVLSLSTQSHRSQAPHLKKHL
ncbi:deoxycytidylate deaminase isoform X1 [Alosa sapidissima]|uniref:deoxycytidylate deaminase isoform X1 n=1 Tax=Alosa sapidissima TaxID=34773 RepID=UPI001C086B2E|nr:deoxycytidylate deaminase isoform X1 [Alosa sapidissima]